MIGYDVTAQPIDTDTAKYRALSLPLLHPTARLMPQLRRSTDLNQRPMNGTERSERMTPIRLPMFAYASEQVDV